MTQRERLTAHLEETYGTEPEHLWAKYPEDAIFRHPASKKWYALMMEVERGRLGLSGEGDVWVLNCKCSPMMIGSLLLEPGFLPAYHMNKNNWISVLLDDSVPDEKIRLLLEMSYDAVAPKGKKRK